MHRQGLSRRREAVAPGGLEVTERSIQAEATAAAIIFSPTDSYLSAPPRVQYLLLDVPVDQK